MTIWMSADTHFNHSKILQYTARPHSSIAEMNADLISRWNHVVQPRDTVYHLGDFAFAKRGDDLASIFASLHGIKHLITGNHDDKHVFRLPWHTQAPYAEIKIDGVHVVLFHYAIVQWDRQRHGALHLHGHHHGTLDPSPNRIDVGVDAWNLTPVSFAHLRTLRVVAASDSQ